jgi:hypothetical protein
MPAAAAAAAAQANKPLMYVYYAWLAWLQCFEMQIPAVSSMPHRVTPVADPVLHAA